jgi:hypothetical protein
MANLDKDKGRFRALQDQKIAFDQDKMWKKVKPKEKKNRMFIWFFGLLGIIIVSMLIFKEGNTNKSDIKSAIRQLDKDVVNAELRASELESIVNVKDLKIEEEIVADAALKQQLSSLEITENTSNHNIKETSSKVKSEGIQQNKSESNIALNHHTTIKDVNNRVEILIPDKSGVEIGVNKQLIVNYEDAEKVYSKCKALAKQDNSIIDLIQPIQKLVIAPFEIESEVYQFKSIIGCGPGPKIKRKLFKPAISAYIGYGIAAQHLSGINIKYINYRRSSEHELENLLIGFKIKQNINKWLYVVSGLDYNRIATKFDYYNSQVSSIPDLNPNDLPANIKGQQGIAQIVNNSTYYNNYHSLNIPLSLGFQYRFKPVLLGLEAGINYFAVQRYDGHLANDALDLEKLDQIPKKLNQIGYSTSLVIGTEILKRHVSLSPTILYYPNNSILGIDETYTTYSLRLGVHF